MFLILVLQLVGGIMKVVNIHGKRYDTLTFQWLEAYLHCFKAFRELGYTVHVDPQLVFKGDKPDFIEIGLNDSEEAINFYNHTYLSEVKRNNLPRGSKTLFIKPTAPAPNYFTIDELGYACNSKITYEKPDFEGTKTKFFFNNTVRNLISKREHKWSQTNEVSFCAAQNVPEDHILVIAQMPGDETVTKFSFGNHWIKLQQIIDTLKHSNTVVLKLHPTFKSVTMKSGHWENFRNIILRWISEGVTVYEDEESLYDILPKTNIAIIENSTAGIECLMHEIPIISYGYPEYHWVTKDMRHLSMLQSYIDDTSWWDPDRSKEWLAWYCTKYQCHNYASTFNRLEELCSEETQ